MINKVECYMLECDGCKEHYEASTTGFSIFNLESDVLECAFDDDWFEDEEDEKHYCPSCFTREEDIITIKSTGKKIDLSHEDNFHLNRPNPH